MSRQRPCVTAQSYHTLATSQKREVIQLDVWLDVQNVESTGQGSDESRFPLGFQLLTIVPLFRLWDTAHRAFLRRVLPGGHISAS